MSTSDLEKQNQATSERTPIGQIEDKDAFVLKEEIKTYLGVEYKLLLLGFADQHEPDGMDNINPNQWWEARSTEKNEYLSKNVSKELLNFGTYFIGKEARMQDKYHDCDLKAMTNIIWLYDGFAKQRIKWVATEIKMLIIALVRTTPRRIAYKVSKIFRKAQSL